VPIFAKDGKYPGKTRVVALSKPILSHQFGEFGETMFFPAPKMTNLYCATITSTEKSLPLAETASTMAASPANILLLAAGRGVERSCGAEA